MKPVILIAGAIGDLGGKIIRELLKLEQLDPLDNNRYEGFEWTGAKEVISGLN